MAGLVIAVMIVQLLTLLALCIHHRQTARRLEWVAKDQADMKAALSSVKVIREEIQGLEEKLDVKMGALSGGQRQAVALLMATMTPLRFLILDEHTAALDPKTADAVMALTDQVVREKKLTAVMVTHNLRYAVEYGDRILMMNQGRVVLDRAGEEKRNTSMEDILAMFNKISMESGS